VSTESFHAPETRVAPSSGTARLRRYAPALFLVLSVTALIGQVLTISAQKLQPRYDEVAYMAVARSYQREGGIVGTIRCHLQGRCVEDNRSPVFEMALQMVASDSPKFYPVAKLFTLGTTLLVGLLGFLLARRLFGTSVAVGTIAVLCLMPSLGEVSSRVLADIMYAGIILGAVYAIGACQGRGTLAWLGTGALIGVAYLTKGNGHLLFPALFCVGLHSHGRRLFRLSKPYAAVAAFLVVSAFLLYRNAIVFHGPFHNFNDRLLWLDSWEECWISLRDPEKYAAGLGLLFQRHSLWDIGLRALKGLGQTIGVAVYSAGLGVTSLKQPEAAQTVASVVPRVITGVGVVVLSIFGLRRALGNFGRRPHALAVAYTTFWFVLAFAAGQQGAGEIGVRYVLPLVVLLTPYAVLFAVEGAWPRVKSFAAGALGSALDRAAVLALTVVLVVKVVWFGSAVRTAPLASVVVPPAWGRTSQWFATHLAAGERFAFPYTSLYSTFDQPFPEPDQRWIYLYRLRPDIMRRDLDRGLRSSIDASLVGPAGPIDKIFVDMDDTSLSSYRDKLSERSDALGPLAFLDWSRCFADGGTPSRFLVFCRPTAR